MRSGVRGKSIGRLTESDALAIARDAPAVKGTAPYLETRGQLVGRLSNRLKTWGADSWFDCPMRSWQCVPAAFFSAMCSRAIFVRSRYTGVHPRLDKRFFGRGIDVTLFSREKTRDLNPVAAAFGNTCARH
jgi:hypothetical protein